MKEFVPGGFATIDPPTVKKEDQQVKVQLIKCKCGKARMLSVIDGRKPDKDKLRLIKMGLEVTTISLYEARKCAFCFDCKL